MDILQKLVSEREAAYDAYRAAIKADLGWPAERGTYARRDDASKAYHAACRAEADERGARLTGRVKI
jgi:hypothetical protein